MPSAISGFDPRKNLLDALVDEWKKARNGIYAVVRGPVDWPGWNWAANRRAVSISALAVTFDMNTGISQMDIVVDVGAKTPTGGKPPQIDDLLIGEMVDDFLTTFHALESRRDQLGDNVAIGMPRNGGQVTAQEFHDIALSVQGVTCKFGASF